MRVPESNFYILLLSNTFIYLFIYFACRQSVENVVRVMPSPTELAVFLPKFTMRVRKGLKEPLQALGLKNMFDTTANFTAMARATGGRNILVSDVQHEAVIEVW